jgi:hypothetical protein
MVRDDRFNEKIDLDAIALVAKQGFLKVEKGVEKRTFQG